LLKYEKKPNLNAYLEETSQSKDMKKFYNMLKRISPKFKCNVNFGCRREDEIAQYLVSLASEPTYADLERGIQDERLTHNTFPFSTGTLS
jgi:hypothetical protein